MPHSFALLSPCGFGNLGDAAIQDAVIANIQLRIPRARIWGITLNPNDTVARHGIRSFPIRADSMCHDSGGQTPSAENTSLKNGTERVITGVRRDVFSSIARGARRTLPGRMRQRLRATKKEAQHIFKSYCLLRGIDTLIISGGGQIDDCWGGAWEHPFALVKFVTTARLLGVPVYFLSVGVGSLNSRLSIWFARRALGQARYRSFRDAGSLQMLRKIGFRRPDPVIPDLAFSFPEDRIPRRRSSNGRRLTIGVSPICYCDPRVWPREDLGVYRGYIARLADALAGLLRDGHALIFFTSARSDGLAVADVVQVLTARIAPIYSELVSIEDVSTVQGFLEHASAVDVVVASRLHSVILAHLVGTPVIALSFERKVTVQMDMMEEMEHCLDIERFLPSEFYSAFSSLRGKKEAVSIRLGKKVMLFRTQLQQQYDATLLGAT